MCYVCTSVGLSHSVFFSAGLRAAACNHGDGEVMALIVLFSTVPITLPLIGMIFFHSYPINEINGTNDHSPVSGF